MKPVARITGVQYAELHCLSNFSFLRGASHAHELVARAAELEYSALAITDECSLAGIVRAHVAAKRHGLKLIIGSEFYLTEQLRLVMLAPSKAAYADLSTLITLARRRSDKGEYQLGLADLEIGTQQNLVIWLPGYKDAHNFNHVNNLKTIFNSRLWIGFNNLLNENDRQCYTYFQQLSAQLGIPMLACGNVHMHCRQRKPLQDLLTAIRHNTPVQQLGTELQINSEQHLRPLSKLAQLYPPQLLTETLRVCELCNFSLKELRYEYPRELVPPTLNAHQYLQQLVMQGAEKRWPHGVPPKLQQQITTELTLIKELQYEYYFLTVFDIVYFARSQNILCQGRGSAANSVVCYCLFITEVDPDKSSLLFERFISKERNEPPDIDVDFEHERREEVIQYIYKKYDREHAALAATVITYRPRSAIRDVGKALGLDALFIDQLAKSLAWWDRKGDLQQRFEEANIRNGSRLAKLFLRGVHDILGFPRHLSQHVGGFVITRSPVSTLVPVENAAMPDRTIIQWDKEDLEAVGLLKIDVLALGMLTAIRKCFDLINSYQDIDIDMAKVPKEDPKTYSMLTRGDSIGVFQVESRAQISMLPRLKPRKFYDLVIEVAIVRPGPIQGDMVHPYLRRREGSEPVTYPNDEIKAVLKRTLGIPIFQEQVIKLTMVAAGFSGGEADQLRRAMATWGRNGNLLQFEEKVIDGMLARGYDLDFAQRLFRQIRGFGDYGFPESHSASFALLVYISAWLKCHYPAAFYCAILNSQPMGFYSPSQLVQDAKRHSIKVLAIDVLHSDWHCTLELQADTTAVYEQEAQPSLRLGLRLAKGFNEAASVRIQRARQEGTLQHVEDLATRAQLSRLEVEALVSANALSALSGHRHQAHWESAAIEARRPLIQNHKHALHDGINLAAPSEVQELLADYQSTGLTLQRHPMAILREHNPFIRCKTAKQLQLLNHGRFVRVAGVVTGRQRPGSTSGVVFLTLEDETGNVNVIVWKNVQQQFRQALLNSRLLMVKGNMERKDSVVHVIAGELVDQSNALQGFYNKSRDFH
ncbi:MAG: error-prone DNA polymerase [Pseudomonadales bacterium]